MYGKRCLPTRILTKEYEILREELSCIKESNEINLEFESISDKRQLNIKNLFEECYELDENEIPSRYKLKMLEKIIPTYNEKDPECDKIWSKIEKKLGNILRKAADICLKKERFSVTEHERYFVSGKYYFKHKSSKIKYQKIIFGIFFLNFYIQILLKN